ncbi:hypothetical protein RYX36_009867 [Vicia faba]
MCSLDLLNPASYSLYINYGGNQAIVNGKNYVGDSDSPGPARFHVSPSGNWAFSTTGIFMDSYDLDDTYFPQKITKLKMVDAELYTNARVTPISLTYYGFCLANGSYTTNLHFAEIMFTDDQTYGSLGRRVFDIYLQEKQVQKDFNIAQEAGMFIVLELLPLKLLVEGATSFIGQKEEAFYLLDWAHLLKERGDLTELVDRRLGSDFNKKVAMVVINVALLCTNITSNLRPAMSSIVSMLEGRNAVSEFVSDSSEVMDEKKLEVMRKYYHIRFK